MQTRVFLIGMMGSGKSRWGKLLADHLGLPFIDLDEEIVRQEGRSIADIFESSGEYYFRTVESGVLKKTLAFPPAVIATGGGAPCFFDHIDWINTHGKSILLQVSVEELVRRIQRQPEKRPLLYGLSEGDLTLKISRLLSDRADCYAKAQQVVHWTEDETEMLQRLVTAAISLSKNPDECAHSESPAE